MAHRAVAAIVASATFLTFSLGYLVADADFDGLSGMEELRLGTRPWNGDTDGDLLADGWEKSRGLNPKLADTDGDGLDDWTELRRRLNPLSSDTDQDGIPDGAEPDEDCNGNGLPAGADGDDDSDGRLDALELPHQRCNPDVDGDGVLDGLEQATVCIERPDCDGDGLDDGLELSADFDPLKADTFGVGLPDAVSWAFAQRGQAAGADADLDGIPDPWEGSSGAIVWGALTPIAGQRDLLVEFVRLAGPSSGRFDLDLTPAYRAVADTFLTQSNIRMSWVETRITLPTEQVPPMVPSISNTYYQSALTQARHSSNPFVTTVVLNPQHDQSLVAHSGIAPLRGMIAAVDYGQFVVFNFRNGTSSVSLTPLTEALVLHNQGGPLTEAGYDRAGVSPTGRINLHSTSGYTLSWQPRWFSSPLQVDFDSGSRMNMTLNTVQVNQASLAHTILHELGHTLGLCHSHDASCQSLSQIDRARQALSTMSYASPSSTLRYLPSEWDTVRNYLTCPPVEPVTRLAQGASTQTILAAKYTLSGDEASSADDRACNEFLEIPEEFDAGVPPAMTYTAPASYADAEGGRSYAVLSLAIALLALGMTAAASLLVFRRLAVQQ